MRIKAFFGPHELKFLYFSRKTQKQKNVFLNFFNRTLLKIFYSQIQIPTGTNIKSGLYLGHHGTVIINPKTIIGKNCNIATGVTIGQENRGARKGCPSIGDNVWIGANSVIVGKITIGNDVLIAPLTFVNFDVPSHAIVIGNPARIIKKTNATKGYINKCIAERSLSK